MTRVVKARTNGLTPTVAGPVAEIRKIPQPHGGALYSGGVPGHKGANGRTYEQFRLYLQQFANSRQVRDGIQEVSISDPCIQSGSAKPGNRITADARAAPVIEAGLPRWPHHFCTPSTQFRLKSNPRSV